jgi:hypothetical protein
MDQHVDRGIRPEADMRKLVLMVITLLAIASVSFAQTSGKISTVWKCAAPSPAHALPVGDAPDHVYVVEQGKCTASSGEIAGVKQKEGVPTEFLEGTATTAKGHGVFVETMANGDKIFYSYEFTGTSKNKVMDTGSNKWTVTSGTGQFKGIKGNGTCQAKGNPDGSGEYTCTGTYTIAK